VEIANEVYTPGKEQIDYAIRVVRAWQAAEGEGRGVFTLDREMVDAPLVAVQQRVLERARRLRCGAFHQLLHRFDEPSRCKRLAQEGIRAQSKRKTLDLRFSPVSHDEDTRLGGSRQPLRPSAQPLQNLEPIHARHAGIQHHCVDVSMADDVAGLVSIPCKTDAETAQAQQCFGYDLRIHILIHNKYAGAHDLLFLPPNALPPP
jgi:hypothetical protein